jgi:hypothetical protein
MSDVVDLTTYRNEQVVAKYLKTPAGKERLAGIIVPFIRAKLDEWKVPMFEIWYPPRIKRRHLRLVK